MCSFDGVGRTDGGEEIVDVQHLVPEGGKGNVQRGAVGLFGEFGHSVFRKVR